MSATSFILSSRDIPHMAFDAALGAAPLGAGELSFESSLFSESTSTRELIFIDESVRSYQELSDRANSFAEVVILDGSEDGIAQIGQILSQYDDLDAVHVVS
ncbi:MAG: DUF4347 domain-containing protein, partial [Cyanobacteria bacterium J06639_1]